MAAATLPRLQLLAERRAIGRGLEDLLQDTGRERRYSRQDWRRQRQDLQQYRRRGLQDIMRDRRQGIREIGYRREDTKQTLARGKQDFGLEIENLVRRFGILGEEQGQAANVAGVSQGGTLGAAAQKRTENLALSRQPIDIAQQRLVEDTRTQLGRLGQAGRTLRRESTIGSRRLRQDVSRDIGSGRIDLRRGIKDIRTRRQRGRREATIGQADLSRQIGALGR